MKVGTTELIVILVVVLIIFGPKNLPKLGKMFGKTVNNFKQGMEEAEDEDEADEKPKKASDKKAAKKDSESAETSDSDEE